MRAGPPRLRLRRSDLAGKIATSRADNSRPDGALKASRCVDRHHPLQAKDAVSKARPVVTGLSSRCQKRCARVASAQP
jgi:hypothetical protein